MAVELIMIRDVILVREEHERDTTKQHRDTSPRITSRDPAGDSRGPALDSRRVLHKFPFFNSSTANAAARAVSAM